MRTTGEVRKIDQLGRIVIPIELRTEMNFKKKDPVEIFVDQDAIVMQKYYPACTFCGEKEKDVSERIQFSGKTVCRSCTESITGD